MIAQVGKASNYAVILLEASTTRLSGRVSKKGGTTEIVTISRVSGNETQCVCPCGHIEDEGFLCARAFALVLYVRRTKPLLRDYWDHFSREFIARELSSAAYQRMYPVGASFPGAFID